MQYSVLSLHYRFWNKHGNEVENKIGRQIVHCSSIVGNIVNQTTEKAAK